MLWQNEPAVIIGRNQNAYAEINRPFVEEHKIPVVRRLTGGGAVFHDLGNLNFTFITSRESCPTLNFERFCTPIVRALNELGVPAVCSGRNDILVDGRKISGNAQCVYQNKVMHHGTLLFSADLTYLSRALQVDPEKMRSKGIKSVRSRVCNLSEYLPNLSVEDLKLILEKSVNGEMVDFSKEELDGIQNLVDTRYHTWAWNYGASKQYGKQVKMRRPYGTVELSFDTELGILTQVRFFGDYFCVSPIEALEASLVGARLTEEDLLPRLSRVSEYISGSEPKDILSLFLT